MSNLNLEIKNNKSILIFTLISIITVSIISILFILTKTQININKDNYKRDILNSLFKSGEIKFDNNILESVINVKNHKYLHSSDYNSIYFAKEKNKITAIIIETIAPDGYNGNIDILVAIKPNFIYPKKSKIINIKITNHEETPGLGDKADEVKYGNKALSWLKAFRNKSLSNPKDSNKWAVKKDNHKAIIDSWTGATITPRAITKAVYQSLIFFEKYHEKLISTKYKHKITV